MKKLKLLFAACALLLGVSIASAQDWTGSVVGEGYALLYNVGTQKYFTRGNGWNTQASVAGEGAAMVVDLKLISDGKYKIRTLTSKGLECLDGGTVYTDQSIDKNSTWTFTEVDAENHIYNIISADNHKGGSGKYLTAEGGSSTIVGPGEDGKSDNAKWKVYLYTDQQAKLEAAMSSVTEESPLNVTAFIKNANFGAYSDIAYECWTVDASNKNLNGGDLGNPNAEHWKAAFTTKQGMKVPNGLYKVRLQAALTEYDVTGADFPVVYLKSGSSEGSVPFKVMNGGEDSMSKMSASFNAGKYYTDYAEVKVVNGEIEVGVRGTRTNTWCIYDNFQLMYYGPIKDLTPYVEAYEAALSNAKAVDQSAKMGTSVKADLQTAISTYDEGKVDKESQEELETATGALETATANANASIQSYVALQTAISNAEDYKDYKPVFSASATIYSDAISAAQGVYGAAEVGDCTAAINALTNGIHAAYESDYSAFANDYKYDYSTLLSQDLTKWATSDYVVMTADEHWNGQKGQRYYEQSGAEWGQNSWSHEAYETPSLPAGKYVMSITARASADVTSTMSVKVGDNDAVIVALPNKGSVGRGITTDGIGSFADGTYANTNGRGWEYRFIAFTVEEESPVTIKFNSSTNAVRNWVSIASPLLKGDVDPNQIKLNQINALVTSLKGYESKISAETYATFADDITAGESATTESKDLDDIIVALQKDIDKAESEAEAFDRGAAMNNLIKGANSVVLEDEATAANWTPAPTYNDWSTEADNTGMVKPFLQNWKGINDGALADNSLTYAPIRGIQKGYYEVSALVRIYSESGEEPAATSATFTVNGESVDLLNGTSFVYKGMKGVYQTVKVRMMIEDALNIGLAYSGVNFNWIAWKNLKVTYLGSEVATAEDYDALNGAITTAEAKTLGFENGEYAPYKNIAAFTSLAEAKAIDQDVVNAKETVVAATTALNNAAWTANTAEVNAFFDGNFSRCSADYASPLDYTPAGWTPSENMRVMLKNGSLFDFKNNNMDLPVGQAGSDESLHAGDLDGVTKTMGDVTISFTKGNNPGSRYFYAESKGNTFNSTKTSTFTLKAAEGKTIKKVEVTMQAGSFDLTPSTGEVVDNVWTGEANEVTFTNTKAIRYIYSINVSLDDESGLDYPGLVDASAQTAMMSYPGGINYGEQAGYEMPLKANTVYRLSLKAAGWNNESRSGIKVSVLNESQEGLALYDLGTPDRDIKGNEHNVAGMNSLDVLFVTGKAGNYVFHVQSGNNMVVTDFELKKATLTISEEGLPAYAPGTYPSVKLARTIKEGFNTLVVPFSMTQAEVEEQFGEGSVVYELKEFEGDVIHFQPADGVTANKPCILKAAKAGSEYSFAGREVEKAAPTVETAGAVTFNGSYAASFTVPNNGENYIVSGGKLYLVDSDNVTIAGTRAYFNVVGNQARSISFDGVTGITTVEKGEVKKAFTGDIFDLTGRKVKNPSNGIYVVEGKKVVF